MLLFLSAVLLLQLSVGVVALDGPTLEAGGPFLITNVHTGLVFDMFDKYKKGPTPLAANRLEECLTASQMWYTTNLATDGVVRFASAHYPGTDIWVFSEGDGLLAATGSVDDAAPVVYKHLPGNVTVITIGGRAVTSGREPGEELKLAPMHAHDKRQQWRFTLLY